MRPPETVYRGVRLQGPGMEFIGVRVTVDELPLRLPASLRDGGFEWGYQGHGPNQLALALVLDATGDRALAQRCAAWFAAAVVSCWGARWLITAAEILGWVERWQREQRSIEQHRQDQADAVLYAFAVEKNHDRSTLERYVREHPGLTEEFIDLAAEIRLTASDPAKQESPIPDPGAEAAWKEFLASKPPESAVTRAATEGGVS